MRKKWNLLIIFIIIALISFLVDKFFDGRSICLFYNTYGVACPSCGMTRSYMALLHGDFHKAIYFHPLFWAVPSLFNFFNKNKQINTDKTSLKKVTNHIDLFPKIVGKIKSKILLNNIPLGKVINAE